MKHNLKVVMILVLMFLIAQLIGMYVVGVSIGEKLAFGIEKPEFEGNTGFIYIFVIIIFVTVIALILSRFHAIRLWKFWFFVSIVLVLTISLSFLIDQKIAFVLSLIAAFYKVIKPNLIIHNLSELFLYGGLAALFVESLNILSVSLLIILIAMYDMYAVWKSKHMIKLAKFQSKLKIFSGFLVPYKEKKKVRAAMLGGGDVGFPLLFAGVVFKELGLISYIIPLVVAISLGLLLTFGDKDKFYPAMPYLGAGCFIGYAIILLII